MAECLQGWRRETLYHADADWIFPSIFAGRFGWHNLRHSLATFLATKVDIKMAQTILRHKKLSTTAEIYAHAVQQNQIAAQGQYLEAIRIRTALQESI
jgi:integrase